MVANNLDVPVTAFVGRLEELAVLGPLVRSARLLSLTGVGGCGKSRLAAELCRRAGIDRTEDSPWPDGIWWVDLGSTTGEADIARICAKLLDVPVEPDRDAFTALAGRLAAKQLLLCLDTCEHVLDEAAGFVAGILKSCPGVQVIATTREPLAVEGEQVWRVPSMTPEDAKNLFLDRARLVASPVASWRDGAEVPAICDRVDRLPLAIELAAAWTRVLSPAQLLSDLDDRFRLLTGGSRRAVARHQALQASMVWSHNLLEPAEQVVFRRLAVFNGWFPLDGAVMVVADSPSAADDVLTGLARLIDKSLLVAQDRAGAVRYRLLDTVRQFAEERLSSTDELAGVRDRHLAWCLSAVEEIDRGLGEDQDRWRDRAVTLLDNVRAALEWGLQDNPERADRSRRLAVAMTMAWFLTGHAADGLRYLNRTAGLPVAAPEWLSERLAGASALLKVVTGRLWGTHPAGRSWGAVTDDLARTRFLFVDAFHWFFLDHERCHDLALQAADVAERTGDVFCRDFARAMAAYSLTARERHHDAMVVAQRVLLDCRPRGDRFCTAFAIGVEQYATMQTGNLTKSVALGQTMVATVSPLGEYFGVGSLTSNLALALVLSGDLDGARRLMHPIVRSVDTAPDVDVVGFQIPMGHACLREGTWQEATRWFSRGLRRLDEAEADWTAARCVSGMVTALRQLGRRTDAERVLAQGRRLLHSFDSPELRSNLDEQEAFLRTEHDPARAFELHHRALATRRDAGMWTFVPDSLEALCDLVSNDRPSPHIVRILAACASARDTMRYPRSEPDATVHRRTVERLRAALGDAFAPAWQDGTAMSLDDAVELMTRGRGSRDRPETGWAALTRVELEVARLVVEGLTNPEIARRLFVSRSTVKAHLSHVYAKLTINNRAELAAVASRYQHDEPV